MRLNLEPNEISRLAESDKPQVSVEPGRCFSSAPARGLLPRGGCVGPGRLSPAGSVLSGAFQCTKYRSLQRNYVCLGRRTVLKGRKIRVYSRVSRTAKLSN